MPELKKRIALGDIIPTGYRVAYIDHRTLHSVAMPIGLHWIGRMVRRLWERSYSYTPSKMEGLLQTAYEIGRGDKRKFEDAVEERVQAVWQKIITPSNN